MKENFSINFNWLSRDYGDAIERVTLADIDITADGWSAFEMEDFTARSVRKTARVSAYNLALWFASNWWKLRWEPERGCLPWDISHKIGAAGGGYLWPDVRFCSDGKTINIHSKAAPFPSSAKSIRYLNSFDAYISVQDFESTISSFIESVIARLIGVGVEAPQLIGLWRELLVERQDLKLSNWRKLEAIMGFDPDEAPEYLVAGLQDAADNYGASAIEEVAAASQNNALADLEELSGAPHAESSELHIPGFDALREQLSGITSSLFPWQQAAEAARIARQAWSLGTGSVSTKDMSEIFGFHHDLIYKASGTRGPMTAGFRNGSLDTFKAFLNTPYPMNRRFALMRLVGDHLIASAEDRLLPASSVKTHRQKFQRAFAQELLCPYAELNSFIDTAEPDDDSIEDAARYFEVSPLLVKTVLVNKGQMERASLNETGTDSVAA